MANLRPEKPRIFLLSLDNKEWFDEMYSRLINMLAEEATLQRASKPDAALRYLTNNTPQAILATDAGLAEPKHSAVLARVVEYTRRGGIVVFGCMFSSFMSRPKMEAFFRDGWSLPWRYGDYHRTDPEGSFLVVCRPPARSGATQRRPRPFAEGDINLLQGNLSIPSFPPARSKAT
ncbi:hypothetical protein W97_05903 [Coniosporium apollinis CBS 100218]|uniref:Uncharacterized protein n=1 Tax=Coniosporium apollinis (strain CBS 100218) TaxID=1168221 RepID=R7YXN8_CONA1|nr:uncharacterized protein W97_05903 [Coniosporium apollinis CBS 100218]EON66657.1 hypothetical protein W97_05903 [Coniosporium apollinis CBS 100218]